MACTPAATSPAASAVASSQPAVITWYTHEGAESLYRSAEYDKAKAMCTQAISLIDKARGPSAPEIAEPLIDLATVQLRLAQFAEAKAAIDRADSLLHADAPDQALLVARLGINKGWRLYSLGESEAALKVFHDARILLEKTLPKGTENKDLAELINNEGLMVEDLAEENDDEAGIAQARQMLIRGWQMRRRLTGENSPETAESLNNLGMSLLFNPTNQGDSELALKTLQKALDVSVQAYGTENPETAMSRTNLALAEISHDNYDDAEQQIKLAIPITQRFLGNVNPDRAFELTTLGRILQEQTQYDDAEKAFIEAVAINEKVYGKNHPNVATALQYLAGLYEAKGDEAKQLATEKRIEKLSDKGI
jgi:tetratricopeptide (TPR) repeat protein